MFRKSMRRTTAGLVLATLLAMSAPAAAAGGLGRHDGGGLWAGVWAWIEAFWEKEGYTTAGGEQGSHIDPNGEPCATCAGTGGSTPAPGEEGSHIDPDGAP